MSTSDVHEKLAAHPGAARRLNEVKDLVAGCIQCGTCSASCPNAWFMDMTPRRMWRALMMDQVETVLASDTFSLCTSCYVCTLRCPRGLSLTHAMAGLKQVAFALDLARFRRSTRFYRAFMDNIRQYGRVREMEMMTRYFLSMKHPFLPLGYAPLGTRLLARHKLQPRLPSRGPGRLDCLFERAARQER